MDCRRGGIYLANLNPSRGSGPGKIRPCLVLQSNLLNEVSHPSAVVLPLSSRLLEGAAPLRVRIEARDELRTDSDILIDQVRTIDNRRFCSDRLTMLTRHEMLQIETSLQIVLDIQ